jgi:putative DNA primase/helicase
MNNAAPVLPPCDHLQYILKQLAKHDIPREQIVRAYPPHYAAEVRAFLEGKDKNYKLTLDIPGKIQKIVDARHIELRQTEGRREWYTAPRHPGIPGRECAILKLPRERFLELCRLSQPELVDALGEETAKANDEENSGEENDDEQENMNENTTRSIGDAILEADEFTRIELPQKRIFAKPWLTEQSITLISGWRGVGKTGFAMELVEAITRGKPFGPWKVGESVPCLYLEGEMPASDIQDRLRYPSQTVNRKSRLLIYSDAYASYLGMPRANLTNPDWRKKIKRFLLDKGVKFWVVDNLASLTSGIDENSKKDWDPINAWLLELRFAGIATCMLHHEGKGGGQRGTSAREDNVDVSIVLKKPLNYTSMDGARFIVKFEKSRVRTKDLPLLADVEFQLTEDGQGSGIWVWKDKKPNTKVQVLNMLDKGLSYDAIIKDVGISKGRITQIKQEAEKKGWLDKKGKLTPDGRAYWYLAGPE